MEYNFDEQEISSIFSNVAKIDYSEKIKLFIDAAKTETNKVKMAKLLYHGIVGNVSIEQNETLPNNYDIDMAKRFDLAYILASNPKAFEVLEKNNITYFHGTNSVALKSLLQNGLMSEKTIAENNMEARTGEGYMFESAGVVLKGKRNFVSVTDALNVSKSYSCITPKDNNEQEMFPIILGFSQEDINSLSPYGVNSDVIEGNVRGIPKEMIKTIFVPSERVKEIQKMVGKGITIAAMDIQDMAVNYSTDGILDIDESKINDIISGKVQVDEQQIEESQVTPRNPIQKAKITLKKLYEMVKEHFKNQER